MIELELSVICLMALLAINIIVTRNLLHPGVVQAAVWLYQLAGLLLFHDSFSGASDNALLIVVAGVVLFTIGTHLAGRLSPLPPSAWGHEVRHSTPLLLVFVLIVLVCLVGQARIFFAIAGDADLSRALVLARVLMSTENVDIYGSLKYGTTVSFALLILLQILILRKRAGTVHLLIFSAVLIMAVMLAALTTGRGPVAQIFMMTGLVYVLQGEERTTHIRLWRALAAIVISTFLIFWIMGSAMGKVGSSAAEALQDVVAYQFGSVPALSVYLENNTVMAFGGDLGANTFRFFHALLSSMGLADAPPSLVQEFVSIPHLTNIYTCYYFYLKDFGILGFMVIILLLGFLHGKLYGWYMGNRDSELALYVLSLSYLPLMQSTGGEAYFTYLSTWAQYLIIALIMIKISKRNAAYA